VCDGVVRGVHRLGPGGMPVMMDHQEAVAVEVFHGGAERRLSTQALLSVDLPVRIGRLPQLLEPLL